MESECPVGLHYWHADDMQILAGDLRLGWAGIVLYAFLLIGSILVLTNLERTFRAAVGTMRWRIKFMVLGVGVLFAVRIYTTSQALPRPTSEEGRSRRNSGFQDRTDDSHRGFDQWDRQRLRRRWCV